MKLSFSTKGWHGYSFQQFCDIAEGHKFDGIELHNIHHAEFTGASGAFSPSHVLSTMRMLTARELKLTCINTIYNPADKSEQKQVIDEIKQAIEIAGKIKAPYVRVRAIGGDFEAARKNFTSVMKKVLPAAEKRDVCLLIETVGIYADTGKLRETLNKFSSDYVAALWNFNQTYFIGKENAETTITNLGAYVRHVHIRDAKVNGDDFEHCLIGEGELPIDEMMLALRSINFGGFISLEWDPKWMEDLGDTDIIFSHFKSYMSRYEDPSKLKSKLYENNRKTGKYIWRKETLIDKTFSEVLDKMVEEFPDQYMFKYTTLDYTRTYSEFKEDVDNFARVLVSLGVRAGSHVAVWATNVPQWFITFWAVTKIGAVLVTVNTAYKIHEAEYLLKQSDTHTLVMIDGWRDSDYRGIMQTLCPELEKTAPGSPLHSERLPFLRNIITVGFKMNGCLTWEEAAQRKSLVRHETIREMSLKVNCHDVCNMQYTSGTTGFPKGVMLTHYNIVNNGKNIGDRMDLSTADRFLIHVPMFHCFGMVLSMTASATHGSTMYPLPYFSAKPSLACINSERITAVNGVPTMFIAMLEHPDFSKTDFSALRTGIMAGSPCPISVMKDVQSKMNMTEITIVYGQTESSPGCTMSSSDDPIEVRVSTVGHNLPEIECRIVNPETGEECPDDVTGEFCARGYNIMKGYYKMPKATQSAIDSDGWLHTGDLACRTEGGNYRITGRLKDMIIRGGENIYPKEIEEFIYTHPKVKDVQVIGVPSKQYGEEIMACVILKEGEAITEDEMKDFIRLSMARHKVPKYISFVTEFPTNAAGKILKYKMRENAVIALNLQSDASIETA